MKNVRGVPPPLKGGVVRGLQNNLGSFCREFYIESAGFYLMSKCQAMIEILHQTYQSRSKCRNIEGFVQIRGIIQHCPKTLVIKSKNMLYNITLPNYSIDLQRCMITRHFYPSMSIILAYIPSTFASLQKSLL